MTWFGMHAARSTDNNGNMVWGRDKKGEGTGRGRGGGRREIRAERKGEGELLMSNSGRPGATEGDLREAVPSVWLL